MTVAVISDNTGATYSGHYAVEARESDPTTNYYGGGFIGRGVEIQTYGSGDRDHGFFYPTGLSNLVGLGATVSNVVLEIYATEIGATFDIVARGLIVNSAYNQLTWDDRLTSTAWTGGGATSTSDRNATVLATASLTNGGSGYQAFSNSGLIAWVQAIVDGGTNYGLVIQPSNDTAYDGSYAFFTDNTQTDGQRPKLTVTYTTGGASHPSTGALTGQGSSVAGSATNFTVHPTSGALSGQGASIAGTANNFKVHTTSGTLSAQGASIIGSANNFTVHPSTGTLNGQGSEIVGSAERTTPSGSHDSSGTLSAQGSSITGSATNFTVHATSGTLQGQGAAIVGSSVTFTVHPSSGIIAGQGSSLSGVSVHTAAGTHGTSGDLNGQGSTISGIADHISITPEPPTYLSAGGGGGGVDYDKERKKKQRVREMVEQALNELDEAPVYVQEEVKKEAVKYVEEQLEYNTIDETKIEHIIQLINDYQLKLIIKEHDDIATRILLLH
ncbi:MAG: hypothetical protein WC733_03475 [Methylophilus sp.]|jgi:hypothetical protein